MDINPQDSYLNDKSLCSPKSITILGSTGSVGSNTVELVGNNLEYFKVVALTANRNVDLLISQALTLNPKKVVLADPEGYNKLKIALAGTGINVSSGIDAVVEAAEEPSDLVMASIVGAAGLKPTLAAVRRGATICLANKECLVSAGDVFIREVKNSGSTLIPVDSEHSAIFQVFDFENVEKVRRIILTASGGPFLKFTQKQMKNVTPEDAIAHPNWDMGAKISVDSATMMNKGLELIEAFHLFPVTTKQIEILVHPQSVIHSMVDYVDGSVLAQLGMPDMRTPIAYALAWPKRMNTSTEKLDLHKIATLTFQNPDSDLFPALSLARLALDSGGSAPTILNAANEIAVEHFLSKRIGFLDITRIVSETLNFITGCKIATLDDVAEADREARKIAEEFVLKFKK
jgi:1-deoxy-D-xylulose-5-phosphate reductoisomerase